ncbi:MAG: hypothetical protein ACPGOV_10440 [Magnetovibrionaceae bacterium]
MSTLDYATLVADYEAGLVEKLRGFGPAAAYLELWVPDEDPVVGITNLLDAAVSAGETTVTLKLPDTVDVGRLAAEAGDFGELDLTQEDNGWLLEASALKQPDRSDSQSAKVHYRHVEKADLGGSGLALGEDGLPEIHRAAAKARLADLTCEGLPDEGHCFEVEGVSFGFALDMDGDIIAAGHERATGSLAAVLDQLSETIIGLPPQEAADHALIKTEVALRDVAERRAVNGIVTPGALGPVFAQAEALLRGAAKRWRAATATPWPDNEYDPGPGADWLALSDFERRSALAEAMMATTESHGLDAEDIQITAIEFDVRVVLAFGGSLAKADRQALLMTLERDVKARVDNRLELYMEELTDQNTIRRLSEETSK